MGGEESGKDRDSEGEEKKEERRDGEKGKDGK